MKKSKTFFFYLLMLLSLGFNSRLYGQREQIKNQPYIDLKPYYWGYKIGLNTLDLKIQNAGFTSPEGISYYADVPRYQLGFLVGVYSAFVPASGYELRLGLDLHFGDTDIHFTDGNQKIKNLSIRQSFLSMPLQFKYCAIRLNNFRPYLLMGGYLNYHIKDNTHDPIRYRLFDYGLSFGLGCDFYFPYFKFSPELSFSYGLSEAIRHHRPELLDDKRIYFTQAIARGQMQMITLTFNFQ